MIWLTWRQFRAQAAVLYGAVGSWPRPSPRPAAAGQQLPRGPAGFLTGISGTDSALYLLGALAVLAVPFIIGMFWGAPLVTRELDAGTHRLAWTLTTRARWLAAKLGVTGLAAMAAAGLLSLAVTWWAQPDRRRHRRATGARPRAAGLPSAVAGDLRLTRHRPARYAAFAFVLGVTIGVVIRRTLPAMACSWPSSSRSRSSWPWCAAEPGRPRAPEHDDHAPPTSSSTVDRYGERHVDRPGAWITAQRTINAGGPAGHAAGLVIHCARARATQPACFGPAGPARLPAAGQLPARRPLLAAAVRGDTRSTWCSRWCWPGCARGRSGVFREQGCSPAAGAGQ